MIIRIDADFVAKIAELADKELWARDVPAHVVACEICRLCYEASAAMESVHASELRLKRDLALATAREGGEVTGFWSLWARAVLLMLAWLRRLGYGGDDGLGFYSVPVTNAAAQMQVTAKQVQQALLGYYGLYSVNDKTPLERRNSAASILHYEALEGAIGIATGIWMPFMEMLGHMLNQARDKGYFREIGEGEAEGGGDYVGDGD